KKTAHLSQTPSSGIVPPSSESSDVRLEITKLKHVTGYIYKLIDKQSGEVVRQWPTEQMVKMREYLAEQQIQLVDEKASSSKAKPTCEGCGNACNIAVCHRGEEWQTKSMLVVTIGTRQTRSFIELGVVRLAVHREIVYLRTNPVRSHRPHQL